MAHERGVVQLGGITVLSRRVRRLEQVADATLGDANPA
jgi:hypothetical protein